tara:strand:- start:1238 stop:1876 length:639 start_codon:yes stop_codon:yes gene_type:complete
MALHLLISLGAALLPLPMRPVATIGRAGRIVLRAVPPEIATQLAPAEGDPNAWTQKDVSAIWAAFEKVYGSREQALVAAEKNIQVLLPFLNSPEIITGAYAVLVDMLGREGADEVVRKNPGVLACDPKSLSKTPQRDIIAAANFVSFVDNLPPGVVGPLRASIFPIFAALLGTRVLQCANGQCAGDVNDWDIMAQGGLGPMAQRFVSENWPF